MDKTNLLMTFTKNKQTVVALFPVYKLNEQKNTFIHGYKFTKYLKFV